MLRYLRNCMAALLAFLIAGLSSQHSFAQNASPQKPPVTISGFEYQFLQKGEIHMNVCRHQQCIPGSKVSYIVYAAEENPDFEQFILYQKQLEDLLNSRAPKGTITKFDTPQQETNELFTLFFNTREQRLVNGTKLFTRSSYIYRKNMTISLISSSAEKDVVGANSVLFLTGLLAWSSTVGKSN